MRCLHNKSRGSRVNCAKPGHPHLLGFGDASDPDSKIDIANGASNPLTRESTANHPDSSGSPRWACGVGRETGHNGVSAASQTKRTVIAERAITRTATSQVRQIRGTNLSVGAPSPARRVDRGDYGEERRRDVR
jgi:hypothetical protein